MIRLVWIFLEVSKKSSPYNATSIICGKSETLTKTWKWKFYAMIKVWNFLQNKPVKIYCWKWGRNMMLWDIVGSIPVPPTQLTINLVYVVACLNIWAWVFIYRYDFLTHCGFIWSHCVVVQQQVLAVEVLRFVLSCWTKNDIQKIQTTDIHLCIL